MKKAARHKELQVDRLRHRCLAEELPFETTDDVKPLKGMFGHDRAIAAIKFGLANKTKGFNIFALGDSGSGKTSILRWIVNQQARKEPTPSDWVYLHNFDDPYTPVAVALPPGRGQALQSDMARFVRDLKRIIPNMQEGKTYRALGMRIEEQYQKKLETALKKLKKAGEKLDIRIDLVEGELLFQFLTNGDPVNDEDFDNMPLDQRAEYEARLRTVRHDINEFVTQQQKLGKAKRERMSKMGGDQILAVTQESIEELKKRYADIEGLSGWFDKVWRFVPEGFESYQQRLEESAKADGAPPRTLAADFVEFAVNLVVNNKGVKGAPVIFENAPTYRNLIGYLEYAEYFGLSHTDFTMIRPGALHRSNGGYLIIQVGDLLRQPQAWDVLKKSLRNQEIAITEPEVDHRGRAVVCPRPTPIPLSIKVILIGNHEDYYALFDLDDDFSRLFKVKAEFSPWMPRSQANINAYTSFIARLCKEDGLLPFHWEAVAELIDQGCRLADHQQKITARFIELINLVSESHYWAAQRNSATVQRKDVHSALEARRHRLGQIEESIYEQIREGTLLLDTKGAVIGQINGIALYDTGDHLFAIPSRITARTYTGRAGVVSIDREAKLSGVIHDKASLILIGLIGHLYAQDKPLSLSASIVFEQTYGEIEGDSASCAELVALISSLGNLPLNQGIAVTGSLNQRGEVQPIGGVNEKVEGVYRICKAKGLDGSQGVIIPIQNVVNLMLGDEVIQAVEKGLFHIYPISHIDYGLEILTGYRAGRRKASGEWEKGTVHWAADQRLRELSRYLDNAENGFDEEGE
ncbi:MAG: AAA family ATPase [Bradymonadales bacterium]|nr:AAA family ATPase [Bradymonadales bacterium]